MIVLVIIYYVIIKFFRIFYYEVNKMNYKININWLIILIFFIGLNIPNNLLAKNFIFLSKKSQLLTNTDEIYRNIKE